MKIFAIEYKQIHKNANIPSWSQLLNRSTPQQYRMDYSKRYFVKARYLYWTDIIKICERRINEIPYSKNVKVEQWENLLQLARQKTLSLMQTV